MASKNTKKCDDDICFTIIIVTFNAENSIIRTIDSIKNQTYSNYRVLVKDGGSTDNTLINLPEENYIKVISSEDSGIYDAMNQAISMAAGDYIIFLNSGDVFYDNSVLEKISAIIMDSQNKADVLYGNWVVNGMMVKSPEKLSYKYLFRNPMCHQALFYRRDLFVGNIKYDINYEICADYELTLRLFAQKKKFSHVDIPVCIYEGGGFSEKQGNRRKRSMESIKIKKQYFPCSIYMFEYFRWLCTLPHLRILLLRKVNSRGFSRIYTSIKNHLYR